MQQLRQDSFQPSKLTFAALGRSVSTVIMSVVLACTFEVHYFRLHCSVHRASPLVMVLNSLSIPSLLNLIIRGIAQTQVTEHVTCDWQDWEETQEAMSWQSDTSLLRSAEDLRETRSRRRASSF